MVKSLQGGFTSGKQKIEKQLAKAKAGKVDGLQKQSVFVSPSASGQNSYKSADVKQAHVSEIQALIDSLPTDPTPALPLIVPPLRQYSAGRLGPLYVLKVDTDKKGIIAMTADATGQLHSVPFAVACDASALLKGEVAVVPGVFAFAGTARLTYTPPPKPGKAPSSRTVTSDGYRLAPLVLNPQEIAQITGQ